MLDSVGFLGLGNMGTPLASNLLKDQLKVFVYNRTRSKADPIVSQGAHFLDSPKAFFTHTKCVFSMVANDEALCAITLGKEGLLENAKPRSIHVSMSTVSPKIIKELHAAHREKGVLFLSAPILGRPAAVAEKKMSICLAGDAEAKKVVLPLLQKLALNVYDFGEVPEQANVVKLSCNFLLLAHIELLAEAFAFTEKCGVEPSKLKNVLDEVFFTSPALKVYSQILLDRDFENAAFKLELGAKDINLLLDAATKAKVPLPAASLIHNRMLAALANNRGHMDWSAIALAAFEEANLGEHHGIHANSQS